MREGKALPLAKGLSRGRAKVAEAENRLGGTAAADFVIARRPATVKAVPVAKRQGESNPELTATVEGALAGDAIAYAISREPGENVGTYAITVQPGDNPDYAVEAVGATLTINPSETPEPTEAQRPMARDGLTYTGGPQELLAEPAQPIEGYTITYSTDGGTTWSDRVPTGTDAGTYTVRVRYVGDESHESFDAGELTVTIAPAAPVAPTEAERPKASDGLTFDGGEQALVEAPVGVPEGHTVEYSTDGGQTGPRTSRRARTPAPTT